MIHELKGTPNTMVGYVATDDVTKEDFDTVVLPGVQELVKRTDKLNCLFVLEAPLPNFTIGPWMKEAMLRLNNIDKWNRAAIVTDDAGMKSFTDFSRAIPGDLRAFSHEELNEAIRWVGEQEGFAPNQVFQTEGDSKD